MFPASSAFRVLPALVALSALSCATTDLPPPRQTSADNARTDDTWLEGERCVEGGEEIPGLRFEQLAAGVGAPVGRGETVRVHYVALLPNGAKVRDTRDSGPPVEIIVGSTHTICGFEKALMGMHAGEQRKAYVPWQLAFGEMGRPPEIQPRTDVVFVIDLYLPAAVIFERRGAPVKPAAGGGGRRR